MLVCIVAVAVAAAAATAAAVAVAVPTKHIYRTFANPPNKKSSASQVACLTFQEQLHHHF